VLRIAASRGFSELTKNVIRLSHGHFKPSLKVSCKSVQPFSRNLATNKETKKDAQMAVLPSARPFVAYNDGLLSPEWKVIKSSELVRILPKAADK